MVKTAIDLERTVESFAKTLSKLIKVDRIILAGDYAKGKATDDSDIWLLVISPSFTGMDWLKRSNLLARAGSKVEILIQSWGFTPDELANSGLIPFLTMMLSESRQVYPDPADTDDEEAGNE